jgi:hypothetical protein
MHAAGASLFAIGPREHDPLPRHDPTLPPSTIDNPGMVVTTKGLQVELIPDEGKAETSCIAK